METKNNKSKKIRIIALFIIVILAVVVTVFVVLQKKDKNKQEVVAAVQKKITTVNSNAEQYNHTLMAESDNYKLYLNGSTLGITLENKKTGAILRSTVDEVDAKSNAQWAGFMKSGVVLEYNYSETDQNQADLVNNHPVIWIDPVEHGFEATIAFPDFGFEFRMKTVLDGDDLLVEIPDESIVEENPRYTIGTINLYPFLGYSYLGENEGYMFIPDGNGALIHLNNKEGRLTGGFSSLIYGEDIGFKEPEIVSLWAEGYETVNPSEYILAPVFGMIHTDDQIGFLGIIEEGAERASIEAYPNGVKIDYDRIYPKFIKRKVFVQPLSKSNSGTIKKTEDQRTIYDIKVRYALVSGDQADYVGLATTYRDYLINDVKLNQKDTQYRTRLDFLGTEREDSIVSRKRVPMTTTEDIRNIYQELEIEGVTNILSLYKGWQNGGLYNVPITNVKADSGIGGTSKLTQLMKDLESTSKKLYLYQDALRLNQDEQGTPFNIVKRVNKREFAETNYKEVYRKFSYLTPARSAYLLRKLENQYLEKNMDQLALSGITNTLYSYNYKGVNYSRFDTKSEYLNIVSSLDENVELVLEEPFYFMWNYTDAFLDMPMGTSNYNFVDEEVPFLSIALKGIIPMYSKYVNFEADKQEFFLQLVENGVYPSFYLTKESSSDLIYTNSADIYSSQYITYKNTIIKYTHELKGLNDTIGDGMIVDHEKLETGVTVVTYDNGVKVYVNYSDQEQKIDGYTVGAMSYKVGEAQ